MFRTVKRKPEAEIETPDALGKLVHYGDVVVASSVYDDKSLDAYVVVGQVANGMHKDKFLLFMCNDMWQYEQSLDELMDDVFSTNTWCVTLKAKESVAKVGEWKTWPKTAPTTEQLKKMPWLQLKTKAARAKMANDK